MRIEVRREGGFAGIERRAVVDTAARPDAAVWHALAEAALAGAGDGPREAVPDGFTYTITVDGRTVSCGDPQLTDAQRELVGRVLREGA
ncbi:protealysin inhibitor emfourin [Streptomyces sp. CC228A]|uniref:protealysin inhibitor emfourin n=1 Tax=Streptomyces sp. CC228A TaxID=2898186 RepID=UPI001F3462B4|nr:protealysin inhibitor emfourin [Streptomyces sp. CC228A]